MTKDDLAENVNSYILNGGKITECAEGEVSTDISLAYCRCGCDGDYTDHSMRAGESGRCSSVIVR